MDTTDSEQIDVELPSLHSADELTSKNSNSLYAPSLSTGDTDDENSNSDAAPSGRKTSGLRRVRSSPIIGSSTRKIHDVTTQHQKAQRRLARKAEAARQSRKRKKEYVQSLEEKVREKDDNALSY